jgi:hypothetical protein
VAVVASPFWYSTFIYSSRIDLVAQNALLGKTDLFRIEHLVRLGKRKLEIINGNQVQERTAVGTREKIANEIQYTRYLVT